MKITMKRFGAAILAVCLMLSLSVTAFAASFTDVPANHWSYEFVERAAANNLVSGVGNGSYQPEKAVSNAEWCQMIANLFRPDLPKASNGNSWWLPAVKYAHEADLLKKTTLLENGFDQEKNFEYGFGNNVFPDSEFYDSAIVLASINRYDMAQTVYRIATGSTLNRMVVNTTGVSANIADFSSVPEKYRDAVLFCYASGFITGVDSIGTFNGSATMTRGAAATVLCRLLDAKNGDWKIPVNTNVTNTAVKDMITILPPAEQIPDDYDYWVVVENTTVPNRLSNSEEITRENIAAMLEELEKIFPDGTSWGDDGNKHDTYYYASKSFGGGGGCNSWAYMTLDILFGTDVRAKGTTNLYDAKPGDLICWIDKNGVEKHWIVVTGVESCTAVKYVNSETGVFTSADDPLLVRVEFEDIMISYCSGNSNDMVSWHGEMTAAAMLNSYPKSVLYSAY